MADKVQGAISFTPIVEIDADADADTVNAIHHNIKGSLGGQMTYSFGGDDKWYYAPNVISTKVNDMRLIAGHSDGSTDHNTDLVGASGDLVNGPNEAAGQLAHFTDMGATLVGTDDVRFLFIKNTGTSDINNTATTNSIYVLFDGGTVAYNTEDAIEIAAGEAWMGKVNNVVHDFVVIPGASNASGAAAEVNGSDSVRCTVAAVIDDGGH